MTLKFRLNLFTMREQQIPKSADNHLNAIGISLESLAAPFQSHANVLVMREVFAQLQERVAQNFRLQSEEGGE